MVDIDPTIPCLQKYDIKDTNNLRDCCYRTCGSFISGPDNIYRSNCAQKCEELITQSVIANDKHNLLVHRLPAPFLELQIQNFKQCFMNNNGNKDKALECCLYKAKNTKEQQLCIDAFNSLISVRESYIGGPVSRCHVFVFIVLLILNACTVLFNHKNIVKTTDFMVQLFIMNIVIILVYIGIMYFF